MSDNIFIYFSNGFYLGFINSGYLYSRDGICLGWIEGQYIWDLDGRFRGAIVDLNANKYILRNRFALPPISRPPKGPVGPMAPPSPPANINPVSLPANIIDAFVQ